MIENTNPNNVDADNANESGEDVKKDFKGLLGSSKKFLSDLLDIRNNTDQEATKESIIADIPFKGHTSWILICSIFIASVGFKRQFYCSRYWSYVNFSANGTYSWYGDVIGNQ